MKIKKLLAFLISVAMIVGMVPTFVFAKEIDFEAEEPAATESSEAEEEDEDDEDDEEDEKAFPLLRSSCCAVCGSASMPPC